MIMFWNRKEVFAGYDIGLLARVRDTLSAAGIRYIYRSVGHSVSHQNMIGTYGQNPMLSSMYYVYATRTTLTARSTSCTNPGGFSPAARAGCPSHLFYGACGTARYTCPFRPSPPAHRPG